MTVFTGNETIAGFLARDFGSIPLVPLFYPDSRIAGYEDLGKLILMESAGANTFTIPSDSVLQQRGNSQHIAFAPGAAFYVVQYGPGQTTFAASSGVTLNSESGLVNIEARYLGAFAIRIRPNEWPLQGRLA